MAKASTAGAPTVAIDGRELTLSHVDRVVFPDDGITKGAVIDYHQRVAGVMVPHIRRRPLTVVRYREAIEGGGFFQKGAPRGAPDWIGRVEVPKKDGVVEHLTCDDAATLVWLANQNALVLHVAPARAPAIESPDWLVFDLDPPPGKKAGVVAGAVLIAEILRDAGLVPYVKTSGSKGLHVVAPLDGDAHRDAAMAYAEEVAEATVQAEPKRFTVEFSKAKREGRILVDVLRNRPAQTLVAPYSIRALPGAPVSAPLAWDELNARSFNPQKHTLKTMPARLAERGDPWAGIRADARPLPPAG
jgi:bifunctional non-homologous end joining protein LigD